MDGGVFRTINLEIRKIAEILARTGEHLEEFFCECGCGETVRLSVDDYDAAAGAWIPGHEPADRSAKTA